MLELFRSWFHRYFSDPQVIILALLLLTGFLLVFILGEMLAPVLAAIVIAYVLESGVFRLEQIKVPRKIAVIIVFCLFMASVLVLFFVLLPLLSRQVGQLLQDLPSMIARGQKELLRLPEQYPEFVTEAQVNQFIAFIGEELTRLGQRLLSASVASVRGLITVIVYLILVPLLVFFFLKDKVLILNWIKIFLPDNRRLAVEVWAEVNQQVSNYIRGKIWEILIVWSVSYITFRIFGLQFAILLGMFVGLSVLIPYIGATVMTFPVALIAFFQWGIHSQFMYVIIAYIIIQALDGNLLVPLLLSEVVNLHPVAIIVAVLLFGGLWGVWGLFFAIPLATLFHAVTKAWFSSHLREKSLQELEAA